MNDHTANIFVDELAVRARGLPRHAILCVVGARPNFMKIAPIVHAFRTSATPVPTCLLHTGQHYDQEMKDAFFDQLGIPEPDIDLGVGSGSHAAQTAEIMRRFESVVDLLAPAAILVVGDVNSTIACALVAAKKQIPILHVEAGLRSFDRTMPEEINRVLTDQISDLLFTTEDSARSNLLREGVAGERIHFVGNVMIDTLLSHRRKAVPASETLARYAGAESVERVGEDYAVLTLHRPSNVDGRGTLSSLVSSMVELGQRMPIVFPVHPRTRAALHRFGLSSQLNRSSRIVQLPPIGYLEMLGLMAGATYVMTDSGGMQEETTALGVPCVTLRENTERPITVEQGTNTIVGNDPERLRDVVDDILRTGGKSGCVPDKWDGNAADRILAVVTAWLMERKPVAAVSY